MTRRIILDCDPGHDDAIAMLLAHGNPDVELAAVTTVAGNAGIEAVTRNALAVARIAGIAGVPFAAGAGRPLVRSVEYAPDIHGDSGLDGPVLPEPAFEVDPRGAVQLIIDTVIRLVPGVLGDETSHKYDSFSEAGLLEYPQYTRPREFRGMSVPDILLSGNHGEIAKWRQQQSLERTRQRRG